MGGALRVVGALAIAALAGGCFQPLYGEHSLTGGPVLRDQLSAVDVLQIAAPKGSDESRIAVEIRNALLYDFTGGGYAAPPTHRLKKYAKAHLPYHGNGHIELFIAQAGKQKRKDASRRYSVCDLLRVGTA